MKHRKDSAGITIRLDKKESAQLCDEMSDVITDWDGSFSGPSMYFKIIDLLARDTL